MKPTHCFRTLCAAAVLAASLVMTGCATQASRTATAPVDPALRDPAQNSAINPEPRDPRWVKRHEGFVEEAKRGGIDVLFLGDSITDFWRLDVDKAHHVTRGRQVWDREFAPLHAANFGISGDRTQHVLWRIEHGELDGIHPKVIVLMIGTNNTGMERDGKTRRNTPEQTVEGVKDVVHELRTRLPDSKILLLAIFPRGEKPDYPQRAEITYINQHIRPLADGKNIRYLDIGPKFLSADGTLSKDIFPDSLHPNQKGYEIWAAAIKPTLLQMLNE